MCERPQFLLARTDCPPGSRPVRAKHPREAPAHGGRLPERESPCAKQRVAMRQAKTRHAPSKKTSLLFMNNFGLWSFNSAIWSPRVIFVHAC